MLIFIEIRTREGYNMCIEDITNQVSEEDTNDKGDVPMNSKLNKDNTKRLTKDKIEIFRNLKGSASVPLDLNKVRDEWKYEKN